MACLKSGVLVKLLEEMKMDESANVEDRNKPALLQIRSIIPVLEGGNLLPSRGFYLKISDASHAIYVSLSQDQNELILGNKLKLGQYIYVQKLESAEPFPLLKELTPLPGRHPFDGTPEEIGSVPNLETLLDSSNSDFIVEKGVISEEKIMEISCNLRRLSLESSDVEELRKKSDVLDVSGSKGKFRSLSASKTRPGAKRSQVESRNSDYLGIVSRSRRRRSLDNDSDSDSTISSVSSSTWTSKRKSWNNLKILGAEEIFDSSVVKQNIRPPRCRSANVSPVRRPVKYDSSDDNSSSVSRKRVLGSAKKTVKSSTKSKNSVSKMNSEQAFRPIKGLVYDRQGAESGISWDSLPSSLVNLGKEVVKQRDLALSAAADALQEACAAESLLNSLSKFSEFRLPEEDDVQPHVDTFLDLQDDMAKTRLIMKSLTNISPTRTEETDSSSTSSDCAALNIAVQRKKNAAAWIKSAVALDLSPCSPALNPVPNSMTITNTLKKSSTSSRSTKQKGACTVRTYKNTNENPSILPSILPSDNTNTDDISVVLASESDEQQEHWSRGCTIPAATQLASSLQDECRKMFLDYIEKYINELERKMSFMVSDNQVAVMMYKVKKVNDWLDLIINKDANSQKDGSNGGSNMDASEIEACHRVRNKIYGILLKHVERTAMAFESSNASLHR